MARPYVHLRRVGCHRLVVWHHGSKIGIAALKTRRRRAMKQLRSKHYVSLRGQPLAHIADVPVNAKCFLEQEYPRMRAALLRTSHIGCHPGSVRNRSEEHTSELQSLRHLVCRLLLEKKK